MGSGTAASASRTQPRRWAPEGASTLPAMPPRASLRPESRQPERSPEAEPAPLRGKPPVQRETVPFPQLGWKLSLTPGHTDSSVAPSGHHICQAMGRATLGWTRDPHPKPTCSLGPNPSFHLAMPQTRTTAKITLTPQTDAPTRPARRPSPRNASACSQPSGMNAFEGDRPLPPTGYQG